MTCSLLSTEMSPTVYDIVTPGQLGLEFPCLLPPIAFFLGVSFHFFLVPF